MILQDAARRGTGLARLIGLAWALGLANVAPATAQTQMQTPTQAQPASALPAIPAPAQAARWSRATFAPSSRPGNTPRWRPRSAPRCSAWP